MRGLIAGLTLLLIATGAIRAEPRIPESVGEISLSFAPVVSKAAPAVVHINASRLVAQRVWEILHERDGQRNLLRFRF